MFADAHCDTVTVILDKNESLKSNSGHIDMERLKKAGCAMQYFAVWLDPKYEPHYAFDRFLDACDKFYSELSENQNDLYLIKNASDIDENSGKTGALLTIEGGGVIGNSMARLHAAYRLGVRCMTLTWNGRNYIADGAAEGDNAGGLSLFGRRVVREMNRLNMIIDVSHLSDKGFYDVASESAAPFAATHSNSRNVCGARRNLTDEQIRHIIKINGYIGLNFCSDFLRDGGSYIGDIVRHAEHILSLGGENVLGFGADFDGVDNLPDGIDGVQNMNKVSDEFCKIGCNQELLNKLFYGNLFGFTKEILKN